MKIAFFEVEGWEERMIRESFSGEKVALGRDKITSLDLPNVKDFEVLSIFIDSRIDKGVLDHFPDLKCIATRSTGYDHIDLAACKEKGIAVTYVPGYGDNTVAEFAFGLLLSLTRKIYQGVDQIKETGSFELTGLRGSRTIRIPTRNLPRRPGSRMWTWTRCSRAQTSSRFTARIRKRHTILSA
ncbi:MAG: D-isomer specific 2-hydroxyacid dehydrogenase NAD-binding protein [Parcubacteria group bacterium GW2011_GWB1_56_8]|nr:MAG: D-isomer specific 2-hydroxyacid dehydrogenase NAD-binding protein [Parcubacteria group bacterium GW2011_GWB1_56_8]